MTPEADSDPKIRLMLLGLILIGILGLIAELFLLGHTESVTQWIPLVSLGAGLATTLAVRFAPGRATFWAFQLVMIVFVIAGAAGVYLHFAGNIEWVHERTPELGGWPLTWKALSGATPAFAPGALAQIGLLGLVYTWRHPRSLAGNSK